MFFWTLIFKDFINICIWGPTRAGTSRKDQHTLLGIAAPIHPSAWVSIAACNGQSDGEAVARTGRFERLTLTRTVTVETPPGTVAVAGGKCVCVVWVSWMLNGLPSVRGYPSAFAWVQCFKCSAVSAWMAANILNYFCVCVHIFWFTVFVCECKR